LEDPNLELLCLLVDKFVEKAELDDLEDAEHEDYTTNRDK
jgi:hypothetical protein